MSALDFLWVRALDDAAGEVNAQLEAKGLVPSEDMWQTKVLDRALEISALRLDRLQVACSDNPLAPPANQ